MLHDAAKGRIGRTAYVRGCRCPDCTKANTDYTARRRAERRTEAPGTDRATAPGTVWDDESPEPEPDVSDRKCPDCRSLMHWTTGRTSLLCPDCDHSEPSPETTRRRAEYQAGQRAAAGISTQVALPQAEIDRLEREMYGRKETYTAQVEGFRDKNIKKLSPDSLGHVKWYLHAITTADTHERLDEIIAQLKNQKWDLQHWYNTQPNTDEIAEGEYYINNDADDDQCQISLPGERICDNYSEHESDDGLRACDRHAWQIWPDDMADEYPDVKPEPKLLISVITPMLTAGLANQALPGRRDSFGRPHAYPPASKLLTYPGEHGYVNPEDRPAYIDTAQEPLTLFLISHIDHIQFRQSANIPYCPITQTGSSTISCAGKAEYQIYAPDIGQGMIWACEPHSSQILHAITSERKIRNIDWPRRISETYLVWSAAPVGRCQLVNKTGPGGNVLSKNELVPCQRNGIVPSGGLRKLGGITICDHHYMALTHNERSQGVISRTLDDYR